MKLTILGLGPGPAALLTQQAVAVLNATPEVYLRTGVHPTVAELPPHLQVHTFDYLYETLPTFEAVYAGIVEAVWGLAQRPEGVVYAVPGHPLVAEATVRELLRRVRDAGEAVTVIAGLSFIEPALTAVGIDPFTANEAGAALQLVDALAPDIDPARPALVGQLYGADAASRLKLELLEQYPPDHPVRLVIAAGGPGERVIDLRLVELDRGGTPLDHLTSLYVPALTLTENVASFRGLTDIIARLRAPDGCPWDREQTHQSLRPYIIEEAYETLEAIERGDIDGLQEELGDLLLNILLQCQIAAEAEEFTARDVIRGIAEKLLRRHPHVFGDLTLSTAAEVLQNWEKLKSKERAEHTSMLKGLPLSLPALAYTRSLHERLSQLGLALDEPLDTAGLSHDARRFFELAVQSAAAGDNPEELLRQANTAFREAFQRLEQHAWDRGHTGLADLPQHERSALWRSVWER